MKNAKRFSWSEYFGDENKVDRTQNGTALFDTTSSNNYYVFVCIFEECTEKGAIYIKRDDEISTLLEDSVFNRCKSTSNGGSVYYDCNWFGHFVQQRNCYYESISTSGYMAFKQIVDIISTSKNYAFEISVSKCGESESKGSFTLGIYQGDVQIENINSTFNKCIWSSSISSILEGKSGYCNFSTFRENNQTEENSLGFGSRSDSEIQTVSYCNVIGNKCGTSGHRAILFLCNRNTFVDHCVFLNNTASWMFDVGSQNGILTITDSYVESKKTGGLGTVKFEREKLDSKTISIFHFYTENCFIERKVMTAKVSYFFAFAESSIEILF